MFYSKYRRDLEAARARVRASGSKVVATERGEIEHVDAGRGPSVLWVHGIVGGADQGLPMAQTYLGDGFRIVAVSRFGYLSSPLPLDASPAAQADLYAALLDVLEIDHVAVVGTSAGTSSSLHFALRHPDRCSALALWSMAVPPYAVPSPPLLAVLRSFFGSDLAIWATITYAPSIMLRIMGVPRHIQARLSGQEREWLRTVMRSFLPVKHRVAGIINDVCVSNPAMNHVDSLIGVSVPVLVVHAVDDPMPPFATARDIAGRLPNGRFVAIQDGGHLLLGHRHEVRAEIASFVARYALI